jgi:hypothetical protein
MGIVRGDDTSFTQRLDGAEEARNALRRNREIGDTSRVGFSSDVLEALRCLER